MELNHRVPPSSIPWWSRETTPGAPGNRKKERIRCGQDHMRLEVKGRRQKTQQVGESQMGEVRVPPLALCVDPGATKGDPKGETKAPVRPQAPTTEGAVLNGHRLHLRARSAALASLFCEH